MEFETRLVNKQYKLSDTENEMADFIKRNSLEVSQMTIQELSDKNYTVPNTVIRLCKKLGYSGYSELKLELKHNYDTPLNQLDERNIIKNTFKLIDTKREQIVVNKMIDADQILLFAVGETAYPVQDFSSTINAFNHKTMFFIYENQIISEIRNAKKSLIILVSISGKNDQLIRISKIAKEMNQYVVSLTHVSSNPLEKTSDLSLFCYSPSKIVKGINLTDKAPVYIVLNSLRTAYINAIV